MDRTNRYLVEPRQDERHAPQLGKGWNAELQAILVGRSLFAPRSPASGLDH